MPFLVWSWSIVFKDRFLLFLVRVFSCKYKILFCDVLKHAIYNSDQTNQSGRIVISSFLTSILFNTQDMQKYKTIEHISFTLYFCCLSLLSSELRLLWQINYETTHCSCTESKRVKLQNKKIWHWIRLFFSL